MPKRHVFAALGAIVLALALIPGVSLASAKFTDVPDSHQFSGDITWLSNSGVTNGCGIGIFCPEEHLTRGQMAAFIHRLSTKQVVDAATVQGLGPDDLRGATGPQGPQGEQGPQGPQGVQGPQGDPGVAGVNVVTAGIGSVPSGTGGTTSAACDVGETVISGGFDAGSEEMTVFESRPNGSSWTVSYHNNGPGTPGITVYAICATVGG